MSQLTSEKTRVDINCDMSEGFGAWMFGEDVDASMLKLVTSANVAAGFHAGDPNTISRTISLAKEYGVGVGVHPGFRDLVGFGRRHIDASPQELVNDVLYQMGAVREFLRLQRLPLQHIKLHGALYMHAAKDEDFASQLIQALQRIDPQLPVLVMDGSALHLAALEHGQPAIREFYADRHYGPDGRIVFTRNVGSLEPAAIKAKVLQACLEGTVQTIEGKNIPIEFESICIHSDTRGALDLMNAAITALNSAHIEIRSFAQDEPLASSPPASDRKA